VGRRAIFGRFSRNIQERDAPARVRRSRAAVSGVGAGEKARYLEEVEGEGKGASQFDKSYQGLGVAAGQDFHSGR
jgi:hypothetical protein